MPAKSQAQRALLNAKFGHKWVKRHHFDNKGKLPKHKTQEMLAVQIVDALLETMSRRSFLGRLGMAAAGAATLGGAAAMPAAPVGWEAMLPKIRHYFLTDPKVANSAKVVGMSPEQFFKDRLPELKSYFDATYFPDGTRKPTQAERAKQSQRSEKQPGENSQRTDVQTPRMSSGQAGGDDDRSRFDYAGGSEDIGYAGYSESKIIEVLLQPSTRPMGNTDDDCWDNYLAAKEAGELQSQEPGGEEPMPAPKRPSLLPQRTSGTYREREIPPDAFAWIAKERGELEREFSRKNLARKTALGVVNLLLNQR